jgi:hypothetical protein
LNILQHRANFAMEKLASARTPAEKHEARQEAFAIKADLEKWLSDDKATAAFKAAKPRSMIGIYKGDLVADHPVFFVGPGGKKITAPIDLPNGDKAIPNPAGQVAVPAHLAPAMQRRGFIRVNDAAITDRSNGMGLGDPTRPNNS